MSSLQQFHKLTDICSNWNKAFADTFSRMMLLGVQANGLVDCTAALPAVRDSFPGANLPLSASSAGPAAPSGPARGYPGPPGGFPQGPHPGPGGPGGPFGGRGPGKDVVSASDAVAEGYIAPTPAVTPIA